MNLIFSYALTNGQHTKLWHLVYEQANLAKTGQGYLETISFYLVALLKMSIALSIFLCFVSSVFAPVIGST
jgi:hypothetical protein